MLLIGIAFSFFVTFSTLPIIIRLFRSINLLDAPDGRKVHQMSKPTLGGISIYAGVLMALMFVTPLSSLAEFKFFIAGVIICLLLGMRDDISSLLASQKIVFQMLAAFVTVYYAGISLTGFYGLFGIDELPVWFSIALSVFMIISLSNAFNLIDGIDGLAASIAIFVSLVFGVAFLLIGDEFFASVSFILASSLVAFLIFNWNPSRIFMGDTGSLVTGFILAVMAIRFINVSAGTVVGTELFVNPVVMALSLLIVPIYDTLRVMLIRIYNGSSPFFPDKRHIHHTLIRQGFSHAQATLILVGFTIFTFIMATQIEGMGLHLSVLVLVSLTICFGAIWDIRLSRYLKGEKGTALENSAMFVSKSA
ncbi:MAG: glycosyltransferase family 4 protein [Cyclobacteriaceae bacterium]